MPPWPSAPVMVNVEPPTRPKFTPTPEVVPLKRALAAGRLVTKLPAPVELVMRPPPSIWPPFER